jgi:predicted TIM-barrel fold metal-dependent hydrolase
MAIVRATTLFAFLSVIHGQKSRGMSMATTSRRRLRVIDAHLHVWASRQETSAFPYAPGQEPPEALASAASTGALVTQMDQSGVTGALIVQPINHKFDHSYVMHAMQEHPDRFKGMLLHDPSLSSEEAVSRVEELALQGFVGVRFNPYLWAKTGDKTWEPMAAGAGLAVYQRCAELRMPVGVMCFQGLELHYDDILALLQASPDTTLVLDHFAFTSVSAEGNGNQAFALLLQLATYPQVYVKISALFRQGDVYPYERVVKERLQPLLAAFGPDRLMFGTDFPFVLAQTGHYGGTVDLVSSWLQGDDKARQAVMGGTAEAVFGAWSAPRDER